MENIILTNNKDLRLVGVKVGVLSTLRFELPLVSASATHVEVIVTSGNVHSAYTATFIDDTRLWQCDIAASQFPAVGRQSYEIAYVLDGKQFWDGKGWIDIADATTSGIEPQPRPEPYRYAVVSVNGYGADAQGAARIPKTFITTDSPETTEGYIEGDICFNRETGATWTLCNVQGTLTWVFNYKNYYTKAETEEAIERVAAYYITADAQGNPFATHAALVNAQAYYSGGAVRTPTRNDYAVVSADETHGGAEWRYIYAVDAQGAGQWEPQYAVEGVIAYDNTVTRTSANGVKSSGIWSAIWGALSALPTGISSLYDWCVSQLAGKVPTSRTVNGKALSSDVTLSASDVGALGNSGKQTLNGYLDSLGQFVTIPSDSNRAANIAKIGTVPVGVLRKGQSKLGYVLCLTDGTDRECSLYIDDDGKVYINTPTGYVEVPNATAGGTLALLSDILVKSVKLNGTALTPDANGAVNVPALPLAGGTMTGSLHVNGSLDVDYTESGVTASIFQVTGSAANPTRFIFYDGTSTRKTIYLRDIATLASPAFTGTPTAPTPTAGDNSTKIATTAFVQVALPYALGTPIVINEPSSETVEGETVYYGAALLANRTANIVRVTAATALDELRITFPAATSGKVRDFGLRVEIGTGSAALAAPALVPIAPTGETVTLENADGTIPELADGTATAKGVTLLYFSEIAPGVFVVKGEQVEEVA